MLKIEQIVDTISVNSISDAYSEIEVQLKFWEIEEIVEDKPFSNEELFCEDPKELQGEKRMVVSISFKDSVKIMSNSKCNAEKRFYS